MSTTYRGSGTPIVGSIVEIDATEISNAPYGNIESETVQAAIDELDNEKVAKAGDTMTGDLTVPNLVTAGNVDGRDVSVDGSTLDSHVADMTNPHTVTKAQVGLTNVTDDAQLTVANNLSDVASAATSRTNIDAEQSGTAVAMAIALGG